MTRYRFIGTHADTVYVGDNAVPVAPNDILDLSDSNLNDERNNSFMKEGLLSKVVDEPKVEAPKEVKK